MVEKSFPAEAYELIFFKQEGFMRKLCPKCGVYFWTQDSNMKTCGESGSDECGYYTFIEKPVTAKQFTLSEMREVFLSFFEQNNHARVKPYPVVARWRNDVYLTHASIINFQPYVTEGISPPPANPLVISQPSIRLTDIPNTGPTFGRHLTIFEMGGAHAFNLPDKEVYWKDDTVRYHHRFATEVLGMKSDEIIYKESTWIGGGNAGPAVECIVHGLEVGTLVFMQYKVIGDNFVELPIRTVDTGYGIDRFTWISQGTPSCFQAIYGDMLNKIYDMANISNVDNDFLEHVAKYSGLVNVDKTANRMVLRKRVSQLTGIDLETLETRLIPIENVWALTDHTKTLSFMLSDGIVPSNIQEGYLARLLFRRAYRLMLNLNMNTENLYDIFELQANYWSKDFPQIKAMQSEIVKMLKSEEEKFHDTLKRGEDMVKRVAFDLKTKGTGKLSETTLTEFYDSHGLPPDIVKQVAEKEGIQVDVPENFYSLIANRHMNANKPTEEAEQIQIDKILKENAETLPPTEQLYYVDAYLKEFEAKVLKIINKKYLVLDRTCFYPEGGGQPADEGWLTFNGVKIAVVDTQKIGKVIFHKINDDAPFKEGVTVKCSLNWEKRYSLMKAHTVTHLINGAARRVLGNHVWQSGTQKGLETSRLDISHYKRLTPEEIHQIELLANQAIMANIQNDINWYSRNEAEALFGFQLYQGGAVPGKDIRVVKTGDWDVEACAGTHIKNTNEVGLIKIVYTERIQDGVERLGYAVGLQALKEMQKQEKLLWNIATTLNAPVEKLDKTAEKIIKDFKEAQQDKRRLIKELAEKESQTVKHEAAQEVNGVSIFKRDFGEIIDVDRMVTSGSEIIKQNPAAVALFYGSDGKTVRIMIMAGDSAITKGVNAGQIIKQSAPVIGGGGGGRPNFAQGGGTLPDKLYEAVKLAEATLIQQLNQ
jgi:alanyl-tRNA synthetase